jgi:outer membrane biosynthesis protein TonB
LQNLLDRIKLLENILSESEPPKTEQPKQITKTIKDKERQLDKKSIEPKAIPEKDPPPETKETNVPVTTSKIVADKVILVIKVDPTKINYFGKVVRSTGALYLIDSQELQL